MFSHMHSYLLHNNGPKNNLNILRLHNAKKNTGFYLFAKHI